MTTAKAGPTARVLPGETLGGHRIVAACLCSGGALQEDSARASQRMCANDVVDYFVSGVGVGVANVDSCTLGIVDPVCSDPGILAEK